MAGVLLDEVAEALVEGVPVLALVVGERERAGKLAMGSQPGRHGAAVEVKAPVRVAGQEGVQVLSGGAVYPEQRP